MTVQLAKATKSPGARTLALNILTQAARQGGTMEQGLASALRRHPGLPRQERAFLLELVQGVKRWEIRLDYVISGLAGRPLKKLHPLVLLILRLGAFQILYLDRVPARAAVDEAVALARARRLPPAHAGFINAVLRRLATEGGPPLPRLEDDPVLALSVAAAHPAWLVGRWLQRYGLEQTRARLEANNLIPPLTIRVNTLKTEPAVLAGRLAEEGVSAVACQFSPVGLHLTGLSASPPDLPSYREGLWLFQDEAAQLATLLLSVGPGQKILEVGAGRGGKTTHLAEGIGGQGLILALDQHRRRLQELGHNLKRWGLAGAAHPVRADATRPLPCRDGTFDAILIDAPCSALGILRRHPEIKTRLTEEDLATFPPRQLAILEEAAPCLRPGGRLLYVTCTTEPEENEELIDRFLLAHPDFSPVHDPHSLPLPAQPFLQPPGFFRTSPASHNLDGFFGVVMVKG